MRVIFQTEGGLARFPGLSRPVVIDSDQLPEELAPFLVDESSMQAATTRLKRAVQEAVQETG